MESHSTGTEHLLALLLRLSTSIVRRHAYAMVLDLSVTQAIVYALGLSVSEPPAECSRLID